MVAAWYHSKKKKKTVAVLWSTWRKHIRKMVNLILNLRPLPRFMNEKNIRISPCLEFSNIYHSDTEIGFLNGWLSKVLECPTAHLLESLNWNYCWIFSRKSWKIRGKNQSQKKKNKGKKDEEKIKGNQKIEKQIEREKWMVIQRRVGRPSVCFYLITPFQKTNNKSS